MCKRGTKLLLAYKEYILKFIFEKFKRIITRWNSEFADLAQSGERQTEVSTSVINLLSGGPVFDPQNSHQFSARRGL